MGIAIYGGTDKWVELGSNTPTSGSSVSFTSLTAYSKYRVVIWQTRLTNSSELTIRLNNDSGSNYFTAGIYYNTTVRYGGSIASRFLPFASSSATNNTAVIDIDNLSTLTAISGFSNNDNLGAQGMIQGWWNGNAQIDRIDVNTLDTFSASNTGTIKIYGRD